MPVDTAVHPSVEGPVSLWLSGLKQGDPDAAERLWGAYFRRLRAFAGRMLHGRIRRTCDGEDVAASAFGSLCRAARAGEFPRLRRRQDLWPLLAALTSHKCIDRARRERRIKRGGLADAADPSVLGGIPGADEHPADRLELLDLRNRLLAILEDHEDRTLRQVVQWRLEGQTIGAIALRMGCVRRTVERKLSLIREIWEGRMR
jgi:RNA polymerase sigma factor (sigma-70 family)